MFMGRTQNYARHTSIHAVLAFIKLFSRNAVLVRTYVRLCLGYVIRAAQCVRGFCGAFRVLFTRYLHEYGNTAPVWSRHANIY